MKIKYEEGATPLDSNELNGLIPTHITTMGELNELEGANISEGLLWLNRQKKADALTDSFARLFHKQLFGQVWSWAGTYRKTAKNIGCDARSISVELRNLFDDTRYWIDNNSYSPKETAVRFHHRLVKIHPFPNGNGRFSRLIADAMLKKEFNHAPLDWTKEDDLQKVSDRRKKYIAGLQSADGGDYQPLFDLLEVE